MATVVEDSTTVYENPIIPGFNPDPSVVYVEPYFILVTSSFHIFPGLPIYVSQDLKTWTQIGNAINRPGQLDLTHAVTQTFPLPDGNFLVGTSGLFAPTIRYHKGTYYIICTNTASPSGFETKNFYVTSDDIWSNQWSDPIYFEFKGIDPSLFIDDDDRAYIHGAWSLGFGKKPSTTIKQFEIDLKTGKVLSEIKEIYPGWAKQDTEGPHIYKKDGWYYLIVAEGGTFEHHMISAARSRNVWGPYESYDKNPLLTADGKDTSVQNVGHGELFQDGTGAWWAVVLGVRRYQDRFPLGRETFLTPVNWPEEGWPEIDQPELTFQRHRLRQDTKLSVSRDQGYVYIRNPVLEDYDISEDSKKCRLRVSETDLSVSDGTTSFLGRRQQSPKASVTASVHIEEDLKGQDFRAGLAIYKDKLRYAEIYVDFQDLVVGLKIQRADDDGTQTNPLTDTVDLTGKLNFRIVTTELEYNFQVQTKDQSWKSLGVLDSLDMTGRDFTGPMFGIFAHGRGSAVRKQVAFEFLEETSP